jgi:hypothetical protein
MVKFVRKTFGESLVQGLTFFIMHLIRQHWKDLCEVTNVKHLAKFILNKIMRGSGNLLD